MALAAPARDLSASLELVEAIVGRPLRLAEQAIDVLRLDQALEHAKDELEAAIRAEMLDATAAWKAGAAVRPGLRVTAEMLDVLERLREVGRQEAELELERLGYTGIRRRGYVDEAPTGRDVDGYLRQNLGGVTTRIEDELVATELSSASRGAVAQALLKVPGARDIASRVISTALIDGLSETWDANADLVAAWEYTAILDGGTCAACRPLDGKRYATLAALFVDLPNFGPNPRCLGGGRCRCRAVPAPTSDVPQNPPEPDPVDALDPGLPGWRRELGEIRGRLSPLDAFGKFGGKAPSIEELLDSGLVDRRLGTTEIVPTGRMAAVEADVIRAGEILDGELDSRIGEHVAETRVKAARAGEVVEARRQVYLAARETYSNAREAYRADLRSTESLIRQELIQARGVEARPWEVPSADVFADPRYAAVKADHEARVEELKRASDAALTDVSLARAELRDHEEAIQQATRATLRELLDEHRGMGEGETGGWQFSTGGRKGQAKQILDAAADLFPTDWILRGRLNALKPRFTKNGRGFHRGYTSGPSQIVVSGGVRSKIRDDLEGFSTAIHELGHHLEHTDPRIKALEWAFYQRRTRALGYGEQEREFRFPRGSGYGSRETYREDAFVDHYMGKTYGNGPRSSYELLTMGLEALWTGSYDLDPEMRRFVLGILATL